MVRPPLFSEVASRYTTKKSNPLLQFYSAYLSAHRWCSDICVVGAENLQFLRSLRDFAPDAVIHSLQKTKSPLPNEDRIRAYRHSEFKSIDAFGAEFAGRFGVLIVTDDTELKVLRRSLKSYGLMVIEGVTEPETLVCEGYRIESCADYCIGTYLKV